MKHTGMVSVTSMLPSLDNNQSIVSCIDLRVDYLKPAPCHQIFICDSLVLDYNIVTQLALVEITCWNQKRSKKIAIAKALYKVHNNEEIM